MIVEMRIVGFFLGDDFKQSEEFVSKMFNIFTSTGKCVDRKKTLKIQPNLSFLLGTGDVFLGEPAFLLGERNKIWPRHFLCNT